MYLLYLHVQYCSVQCITECLVQSEIGPLYGTAYSVNYKLYCDLWEVWPLYNVPMLQAMVIEVP